MVLHRQDLIYPELCYQIIGILFDVYNQLGYGYQERYYQKAIAIALAEKNIVFKREIAAPLNYRDNRVGEYRLDFLIENKVILEIKKGEHFSKKNIEQIYAYLKATNLLLGILVNFTPTGIKFKRIVNIT